MRRSGPEKTYCSRPKREQEGETELTSHEAHTHVSWYNIFSRRVVPKMCGINFTMKYSPSRIIMVCVCPTRRFLIPKNTDNTTFQIRILVQLLLRTSSPKSRMLLIPVYSIQEAQTFCARAQLHGRTSDRRAVSGIRRDVSNYRTTLTRCCRKNQEGLPSYPGKRKMERNEDMQLHLSIVNS